MSVTLFPPTPRDFDIHRMSLVLHISTWRIAEKHGISQTRVRQIIQRVSQWLAATVPVKTELEREQEVRLAQHLAAEQMRQQIETLQNYWDGSGDPKYLRHQTRVIAALARLGVVPGAIEALQADATIGPYDPNEPQPPWSEDNVGHSGPEWPEAEAVVHARTPSAPTATPAAPPPPCGAFSASASQQPPSAPAAPNPAAATHAPSRTSGRFETPPETMVEGLNIMENNLLSFIDNTPPADTDRLTKLRRQLDEVRASKANYELRIAPDMPGAEIRLDPTPPTQRNEQEQAELAETRS